MAKVKIIKQKELTKELEALLSTLSNFHKTGSILGMKQKYGKDALLVRCGNYVYNVTSEPHIYNTCAK